jgi:hypothetical protein
LEVSRKQTTINNKNETLSDVSHEEGRRHIPSGIVLREKESKTKGFQTHGSGARILKHCTAVDVGNLRFGVKRAAHLLITFTKHSEDTFTNRG